MKNMPTTGACLAAKEIADYQTEEEDWTVLDLAEIIDRHSAAPDLLAVLKSTVEHWRGRDCGAQWFRAIQNAIARAS